MTTLTAVKLEVGQRVRLDWGSKTWRVNAVSENFVVCVQQSHFKPKGALSYTVLDWRNGVRGACNLIGGGFGDGSLSEAECAAMLVQFECDPAADPARLAALAAGETSWVPTTWSLEVSHRNRVPIENVELVADFLAARSPR